MRTTIRKGLTNIRNNTDSVAAQTIIIPELSQITTAARAFADSIGDRRVFAFYGSMGAGKTTLIRAICQQLGVQDDVASPTFAIVNEYRSGRLTGLLAPLSTQPIYHFDFYRIRQPQEVFDIGFDEYVCSGNLCFMEWPELIEQYLPSETVPVHITTLPDGTRQVQVG